MSPDFIGAFMIGLVGAGHCMGMCGGIASLLSMGAPNNKLSSSIPLFYNFGRLASYALIGAMVGGAISGLSEFSGLTQSLAWLRFVAALFMILVALYIAKWWQGLLVVEKAGQYSYRDRKVKKRVFRSLWIQRINAGCRLHGLKYSSFVNGLKKINFGLNRKVIADLAANDPNIFKKIVDQIQDKK